MDTKTLGKWLYIIGMIVAVIAAVFSLDVGEWFTWVLLAVAVFAGIFYADPGDAANIGLRYLALAAVAGALNEFVDPVGPFITDVFTAVVWFLGPYVLTALVMRFFKKEL